LRLVVGRCTESESGGRMIDAILTNTMLPSISREFLARMIDGGAIERVRVSVEDGDFAYRFDECAPVITAMPGVAAWRDGSAVR
jgi:type VI secretion system protein VasG